MNGAAAVKLDQSLPDPCKAGVRILGASGHPPPKTPQTSARV
jgi:hypothetical protein